MSKIIVATGNEGKMVEIRNILKDLDIELLSLKDANIDVDVEENGKTFEENAIIKAEAIVGLVSVLLFELFPLQITSIFGSEDGLYNEFAVLSFRIFLSMIILTCIQKSTSVFLQSLGKPVMAMGLSLLRDFVLSVPLAIFLPMFFGVEGALLSAPVADIVTTVAVVLMSINVVKELDSKINSDEDDAKEAQVA